MRAVRQACFLLLAVFLMTGLGARAEEGDVRQGEAFARAACAQCHAVGARERYSPNRYAPSFRLLARTPGMTATALDVWFQTPHPSMPNLVLRNGDRENVSAYILSLKPPK